MLLDFDEVLPVTVNVVEGSPVAGYLTAVTLIRDLRGIVHLALESDSGEIDVEALRKELGRQLGPYWSDQIWQMGQRRDRPSQALDELIRRERQEWSPPDARLKWYKVERVFSKSSWLISAAPPWELNDRNPAIVSFYSFKGGVGRSIALAAVALLMAQAGHSVVVVDLDLEAPGVGLLLTEGHMPEMGVVDYLLARLLQRARNVPVWGLEHFVFVQNDTTLIGSSGEPIRVFPAGRLTSTYLEKIARLDYESFVANPPNPLVELLEDIRTTFSDVEFILIDVRAGLHDIGGFSLNGLSHLDILFGLDTDQSWDGFRIVLPLIGRSPEGRRRELFFVHAMATPERFDPQANERFRQQAFDLLNYYYEDEEMPDLQYPDAPYGIPIFFRDELLNVKRLRDILPLITDIESDYMRLTKLIGTYLERETL